MATTARAVVDPAMPVDLPIIGKTTIKYRVADTAFLEVELEPFLDKLNAKLAAAGEEPYDNVWDALEEVSQSSPMQVMPLLLRAGLRHHGTGIEHQVDELPPTVWNDEAVTDAINKAIALAFGVDPDEAAKAAKAGAASPSPKGGRAAARR